MTEATSAVNGLLLRSTSRSDGIDANTLGKVPVISFRANHSVLHMIPHGHENTHRRHDDHHDDDHHHHRHITLATRTEARCSH
jgi:hypothetical protein